MDVVLIIAEWEGGEGLNALYTARGKDWHFFFVPVNRQAQKSAGICVRRDVGCGSTWRGGEGGRERQRDGDRPSYTKATGLKSARGNPSHRIDTCNVMSLKLMMQFPEQNILLSPSFINSCQIRYVSS
jgi:hypothetical protein